MSEPSHLFKPGQSGNPSGRPIGATNKNKINVAKLFAEHNFNPLFEAMKIARTTEDIDKKFERCMELAQYYAPKLKAIENSMDESMQKHDAFLLDLLLKAQAGAKPGIQYDIDNAD